MTLIAGIAFTVFFVFHFKGSKEAVIVGNWKCVKDRFHTMEFRADGTMTDVDGGSAYYKKYRFMDENTLEFESLGHPMGDVFWHPKAGVRERLKISVLDPDEISFPVKTLDGRIENIVFRRVR